MERLGGYLRGPLGDLVHLHLVQSLVSLTRTEERVLLVYHFLTRAVTPSQKAALGFSRGV